MRFGSTSTPGSDVPAARRPKRSSARSRIAIRRSNFAISTSRRIAPISTRSINLSPDIAKPPPAPPFFICSTNWWLGSTVRRPVAAASRNYSTSGRSLRGNRRRRQHPPRSVKRPTEISRHPIFVRIHGIAPQHGWSARISHGVHVFSMPRWPRLCRSLRSQAAPPSKMNCPCPTSCRWTMICRATMICHCRNLANRVRRQPQRSTYLGSDGLPFAIGGCRCSPRSSAWSMVSTRVPCGSCCFCYRFWSTFTAVVVSCWSRGPLCSSAALSISRSWRLG